MLSHRCDQPAAGRQCRVAGRDHRGRDRRLPRRAAARGVVLSKMDEAVKLGPALDALIRHSLKVVGVANGQRVPEDWHRLSANALVQRALRGGGGAAWRLDADDVNLVFAAPHARRAPSQPACARLIPAAIATASMPRPRHLPPDQADGLRRLFAARARALRAGGREPARRLRRRDARAPLQRLRRARRAHAGRRCGRARAGAGEMALVDLAACVEPLSERVAYLAARGLPLRFVDTSGSTPALPAGRCRSRADEPSGAGARRRPPTSPPVRAIAHARRRRPLPAAAGRRPPGQRHARLRGDEAAGAARRADGARPAARRGRRVAARRAHRRAAGRCAPTTSSARCCATGRMSIRPATPTEPPAGALRRWAPTRSRRRAGRSRASPRRDARHAAAGQPASPPRTRPALISGAHRMYTAKGQLDLNATLKQYSPLVRRLAHQMIAKLPANVEIDDLIQVGMIGLADALSRFDAGQGVQFETFATQRIRGAMLDELRGNDYLSRGTRKQQRSDRVGGAQARAAARPRAGRERDRASEMGLGAGRIPGAARQGARHAARLPRGHEPATRATTTSSTATSPTRSGNPLAPAAGPAHARGAGRGDQGACPSASST